AGFGYAFALGAATATGLVARAFGRAAACAGGAPPRARGWSPWALSRGRHPFRHALQRPRLRQQAAGVLLDLVRHLQQLLGGAGPSDCRAAERRALAGAPGRSWAGARTRSARARPAAFVTLSCRAVAARPVLLSGSPLAPRPCLAARTRPLAIAHP